MPQYQHYEDPALDRADHVWAEIEAGKKFICVLCGAITRKPPPYPTPPKWMPDVYEKLTSGVRALGRAARPVRGG